MANNRIINTRAGWLYEYAAGATPSTFTALSEGDTFAAGTSVIRVTADAPQFGARAYTVQRTDSGGAYADAYTINLNVPDGTGTTRTDVFVSTDAPPQTTFQSQDTIDKGHIAERLAFEQQTRLELSTGVIFDYQGNLLRGVWSGSTETKELEEGGIMEGYDVTLTSSRLQWVNAGTQPIVGATIRNAGKRYKIESVITLGSAFEFGLMKKQ